MTLTPTFLAMNEMYAQANLVIFGLGREGESSYRWLRQWFPATSILLIDDQPLDTLGPFWQHILTTDPVEFISAQQAVRHPGWIKPNTVVVKTPGLPLRHPLVTLLHHQDVRITSNTALLYQVIQTNPELGVTTIGITGTKGKSTTTAFIFHILQTAQLPAVMGGNIGVPPLDLLTTIAELPTQQTPTYIVLEQSCHQLDDLRMSPQIAVIQNIVPEHLDYYGTFERYQTAKSSIARYQQTDDVVIANPHHPTAWELAELSAGRHLENVPSDWFTSENAIYPSTGETLLPLSELSLRGQHNQENLVPGLLIAQELHLGTAVMTQALRSFRPLPHRLELVRTINQVEYINDSLATVPDAAVAALEAFPGKPAILIAGGFDRNQDFTVLAKYILSHGLRGLLLFPPTGQRLHETLEKISKDLAIDLSTKVMHQKNVAHMAEAVKLAHQWAQPGDVVLLSPASASFGEFKDYADRGRQFAEAVADVA